MCVPGVSREPGLFGLVIVVQEPLDLTVGVVAPAVQNLGVEAEQYGDAVSRPAGDLHRVNADAARKRRPSAATPNSSMWSRRSRTRALRLRPRSSCDCPSSVHLEPTLGGAARQEERAPTLFGQRAVGQSEVHRLGRPGRGVQDASVKGLEMRPTRRDLYFFHHVLAAPATKRVRHNRSPAQVAGRVAAHVVRWEDIASTVREHQMGRTARWLVVGATSLLVFGVCVWLGDLVLPWDRPERIGTGAGAGAVLAAVLAAWASSAISSSTEAAPRPDLAGPTASGERSVATGDNSGVIVTGDGGTVQR